jgi:hypothetical protein
MARARKAVAAAYDELDPDLNPKERGKAQRNIRRHIRDSYALEYLPAASWKKGIAAPRYLISGAQGVGKTAAVVGAVRDGETKRGLMHEGSGLVTVLFSPDHAKSAEAFNDYADIAGPFDPVPVQALGRSATHPEDPNRKACDIYSIERTDAPARHRTQPHCMGFLRIRCRA